MIRIAVVAILVAGVLSNPMRPLAAGPVVLQDPSADEQELLDRFVAQQDARIQAIERAKQATISVFAPNGSNGGSGVIISEDGLAITNYHVVKPCGNFMKCSLPNGKLYDAVIVSIDPVGDVAMIRLFGDESFPVATIANSRDVRVGDWCFAIGNPFLLATDFQPTVTFGIVSGVSRYQFPADTLLEYTDCIQTDAAINPGNSGGPLFNEQGELIGINGRGSFEKRGRVNVGVGYAISINQVMLFLGNLKSGRILDHATLGATVGLDGQGRVVVTNLLLSCDAYRRGLRIGDEIRYFGDREIDSVNTFKNVLGIYPRDYDVPLIYVRDGQTRSISVRLEGVHSRDELVELVQGNNLDRPTPIGVPEENPYGPSDEAASQFQARAGYANYHFNLMERNRFCDAIGLNSFHALQSHSLTFEGTLSSGETFRMTLAPDGSGMLIDDRAELIDESDELAGQLAPEGSGGLLLAFHIWARMLREGPDKFGDVWYYGEAPHRPTRDSGVHSLMEVMVGTFDTVESRWYVPQGESMLRVLEVAPDIDVDPCELHFSEYRSAEGLLLPHRIEVRHADNSFAFIDIHTMELRPHEESEPR